MSVTHHHYIFIRNLNAVIALMIDDYNNQRLMYRWQRTNTILVPELDAIAQLLTKVLVNTIIILRCYWRTRSRDRHRHTQKLVETHNQ